MTHIILDNISCKLETKAIAKKLHIEENTDDYAEFLDLLDKVKKIAKPKAIYKPVFIEDKGKDYVVLDDQRMLSTLMPKNLKDVHRVFAYVSTCGDEIEQWSKTITDILHNWWMDTIKEHVLGQATTFLHARVKKDMMLGKTASMHPGSLPDWPISEQAKLFALLGDVKKSIGVELTDSMLMTPSKTISGFYFETQSDFVNCQLCTRENCTGRKVPFDEAKYNELLK